MGWLFDVEQTSQKQYAPDLLNDRDIVKVSRMFLPLVGVSLLLPALIGGLWSWSWQGALTAFFWGSLVRISLLHHTTWSINSICHAVGERPFKSRDRSGNVWWLAILSMGESWHNLHHADPTSARHGVLRGQIGLQRPVDLDLRAVRLGPRRPLAEGPTGSQRSARHDGRVTDADAATRGRQSAARVRMTGKQRREQLLDVGRSLFAERGFGATSVEEIASKAGVSKPVVYEHFGGKEGLYAVVVDREMRHLLDAVTGALTSAGLTPACCSRRRRSRCSDYIEQSTDVSASSSATLPLRSRRYVRQPHQRRDQPGRAPAGCRVQGAGLRRQARSDVRPDARRHGGAHGAVVARRAQAQEVRGRRSSGQPGVERPVWPRSEAAPEHPTLTTTRHRGAAMAWLHRGGWPRGRTLGGSDRTRKRRCPGCPGHRRLHC
jgi:AcrR family transcriptional regulator